MFNFDADAILKPSPSERRAAVGAVHANVGGEVVRVVGIRLGDPADIDVRLEVLVRADAHRAST